MSLLVPDSGLLFWMLLSFGIVFFVLAKYGFPVIVKMVNERKEYITVRWWWQKKQTNSWLT